MTPAPAPSSSVAASVAVPRTAAPSGVTDTDGAVLSTGGGHDRVAVLPAASVTSERSSYSPSASAAVVKLRRGPPAQIVVHAPAPSR